MTTLSEKELLRRAALPRPPWRMRSVYLQWIRARKRLGLATDSRTLRSVKDRRRYMRDYMRGYRAAQNGKGK